MNDFDNSALARGAGKPEDEAGSLREYYDAVSQTYIDLFFDDLTDAPWLDLFLRRLSPGAHVLDAGCGPGNLAKYLTEQGVKVTGVDISYRMIDAARSLVSSASFCVMDFTHLGFPPRTFDGVLCAYSFPHVSKRRAQKALLGFRRVLVSSGVLYLLIKLGEGDQVAPSPLAAGENCYLQLWEEAEVTSLLKECSFELLEQERGRPTSPSEFQFEKLLLIARSSNNG